MTIGDIGIIAAILFLAFKPGITEQANRLKKRIKRRIGGR